MIDTNLKSVWLCMKHEIAQMLEQVEVMPTFKNQGDEDPKPAD